MCFACMCLQLSNIPTSNKYIRVYSNYVQYEFVYLAECITI